jgi:mRNA interferase RelE/StbE
MYTYEFKPSALKKISRFPKSVQQQIIKKLDYFIGSDEPLKYAHRLINYELGTYRFRIGDYRVVFDVEGEKLIILDIDHRKDIYR